MDHESTEGALKTCEGGQMTFKVVGARYATRFEVFWWEVKFLWCRFCAWLLG